MSEHRLHHQPRSSAPLISTTEPNLFDSETEESATESGESASSVDFRCVNGTLASGGGRSGHFARLPYCGCCPGRLLRSRDWATMCLPKPPTDGATSSRHHHPPCRCHRSSPDEASHRRKAVYRLLAAGAISIFVIIGEVIGKQARERERTNRSWCV